MKGFKWVSSMLHSLRHSESEMAQEAKEAEMQAEAKAAAAAAEKADAAGKAQLLLWHSADPLAQDS